MSRATRHITTRKRKTELWIVSFDLTSDRPTLHYRITGDIRVQAVNENNAKRAANILLQNTIDWDNGKFEARRFKDQSGT